MLDFIIFILATIGCTFALSLHYIFKWLRDYLNKINPKFLGKLIKCSACAGFWSGLLIRYIQIIHLNILLEVDILLYGFVGSFISYLAYLLLKKLIDKYD